MKQVKNRKSRLTPGIFLELYTLGYIIGKDTEVYGKEILDNIKMYNAVWQPSHGTFYPVINNMLEEGLIEYAYEYDSRKYYAITDIGKDYYNARAQVFKDMLLQSSNFYLNIAKTLPTNAVV